MVRSALLSILRGRLIAPEDHGYDTARKLYNGMIDKYPALIARCGAGLGSCGSGGDFGVVGAFLFRLHPVSTVYAGPMLWDLGDAPEVMKWYKTYIHEAADAISGFLAFMTVPPGPPFPEHLHGKKMCGIVWCDSGDQANAGSFLTDIPSIKAPALDFVGPMPPRPAKHVRCPVSPGPQLVLERRLVRQLNPHPTLVAAGCSLGAYHAANLAFKHPQLFHKMVGLSGRYDLTTSMEHFDDLFEGYRNETIYYNMPGLFIPNLQDPRIIIQLKKMEIVFVVGEHDVFLENNRIISNALWEKGIWNALHLWDGQSHKARYWRHMVQLYL